jgi:hypothetical protein
LKPSFLLLDSIIPITQLGALFILTSSQCLYALSPINGHILTRFCPNDEIPTSLTIPSLPSTISPSHSREFILSHLFPHPEKVAYNKPFPILAGSILLEREDLEETASKTEIEFILYMTVTNRMISFTEMKFISYPTHTEENKSDGINRVASLVIAATSSSSTSSSSSLTYQQQKFFFYSFDSTTTLFNLITSETSIGAGDTVVSTLNLSTSFATTSSSSSFTHSLHMMSTGQSVVHICSSPQSISTSSSQSCVIIGIDFSSSKDTPRSLIAQVLHTCRGHHVSVVYESDLSVSKSGSMKNILCVSFSPSSTSSDEIQLTLITPPSSSSSSSSNQFTVTHSSLTVTALPSLLSSSSSSSLSHLSYSTYLSKSLTDSSSSSSSSSSTLIKLFLQTSSGQLFLFQQGRGLRWSRDESLARVRQGVILDNTAILDNQGLTTIPSFHRRLELQLEDLKSKLFSLQTSFQSIPHTISSLVHESLPPHLAASLMPSFRPQKKEVDVNVDLFGFNKISIQLTSRYSPWSLLSLSHPLSVSVSLSLSVIQFDPDLLSSSLP